MHNRRDPKAKRGNKLIISITLDPDQVQAIDEAADERRASRAQIVREAVDLYLTKLREQTVA